MQAGRRAGRTSSPDFFLTIWGFRRSSSSESSSEPVNEFPSDLTPRMLDSVADLVCEILLPPVLSPSRELVLKLWCMAVEIAWAWEGRTSKSPGPAGSGLAAASLARRARSMLWYLADRILQLLQVLDVITASDFRQLVVVAGGGGVGEVILLRLWACRPRSPEGVTVGRCCSLPCSSSPLTLPPAWLDGMMSGELYRGRCPFDALVRYDADRRKGGSSAPRRSARRPVER